MKNLKKLLVTFIAAILIVNLMLPPQVITAASKYGVILGDKNNNFKLYDDIIVLSPNKNLMMKAYDLCKWLGLSYSYNKASKKLTIKNPNNDKYIEYVLDSKAFTYYASKVSKGVVKKAAYQAYYDTNTKSYVIHAPSLKYILGYHYYKDMKNYYSKMGYQGLVVYSINGYSTYDMPITEGVISYINAKTFTTKEDLLEAIRMNLLMHKTGVKFLTNRAVMDSMGLRNSILDLAIGLDSKDTSKDADYFSLLIDKIIQKWAVIQKIRYNSDGTQTIIETDADQASLTIDVQYETTLSQERTVDSKIASILKSLNLTGASDYIKVKKIHDYVINHAKYDTTNQLSSAYDLLVKKTAVCEGYTLTAYRLFVDAGLESKIISGKANEVAHAWNLVKIDDKWYNIDLTWDDPITNTGEQVLRYNYFLKNQDGFWDHIRLDKFNTSEFLKLYPIAEESYVMK